MSCSDSAVAGVNCMVTIEERNVWNTCSAIDPARVSMRRGGLLDLRVVLPKLPYYHFSLTRPPDQPVANKSCIAAADFTLNVNTALTVDDPLFKGLEAFRDNVAKSSNGEVEIKLFPGAQFEPAEDVLEQARALSGAGA